jgi:hypothetical protein
MRQNTAWPEPTKGRRVTSFNDEFYRDILDGLAVYADSGFHRDVLATITRHQEPAIGVALNKNQMASKRWLADSLHASVGPRLGDVLILGGWLGALAAVLLHDPRFGIGRVVSVDVDPRCEPIAASMNATHARTGRFEARTIDMLAIDYASPGDRSSPYGADVIINTSCEHLPEFDRWYARIPDGQLLVPQSNDYVACREHVNCAADLAAFAAQAPMRDVVFAGERPMRRYTRFMLIGRK